ncbi:thiamine diphosphokinase [Butyrivibrio sp. DSM 10294]|uniref:thiamine diphosphokinase n=1 Tax=Butyrivibrio sp. DSM 10294 TaxID=2972457 RepID=UPI00234F8E58|nr:thiamine diphosphokinase [Butyrivibrio sp. DSM 10294]MDC7295402.1 thiamine diphosphokinase [Butyrivibrio sp. DSM 10294]
MNLDKSEPKCIIISAGHFVPMEIPIGEEDLVIACDAGYLYAEQLGILPDLIVGDFDSLSQAGPAAVRSLQEIAESDPDRIVKLDVRKDDTDTIKAVKIAFSKGYRKFMLYGCLGGSRIDHSLANIQTLLFIKHHGGNGYIMEENRIVLIAENETIRFHRGNSGMISVFSVSEISRGVTLRGLMYTMENGELGNDFPLGVSNEFIIDEEAEITVREGTLLITAEM